MKINVITKNLHKALISTERIIGKSLNLPILSCVLLKTENGRLKLSSTNLEIGINYWIGSKINEEGEIAVPVKILSDFISNLPEDKIEIHSKENILNISTDDHKTQMVGFETKDFPLIPKVKGDPITTINSKVLANVLSSVFDSISLSETRPELTGVYVGFSTGEIIIASTDSFRLSEKKIEHNNNQLISVIIPRNTISEIIRLSGELDEDLKIYVSENQIQVSGENIELVSRLISGHYPDYQKIIPVNSSSKAIYNKEELLKAVKLTSLFSSNINDIKIKVDEDFTEVSAKHVDRGETNSKIKSKLVNEKFDLSLNYNYLLDGLKNIQSKEVVLEYVGQGSPLVLRPNDKDIKYLYLIMPLRS